jgi:disulfide bond formation protein DsbB
MSSVVRPVLKFWPLAGACASAAMLAIAHAFETFGGLAPCTLCLYQREVYWIALAAGMIGFALGYVRLRWAPRATDAVLALVFLAGAAIAAYHAGAEWKWWPGPTTCSGGGSVSAAGLSDFLNGAHYAPPRCDQAAWRMLGLSMAGWNVLISLGLVCLSLAAALGKGRADVADD